MMSGSGSSNPSTFDFRRFLKKIDSGLVAKDIQRLKFLCKDLGIPAQNLEQITRGLHLFKELEKLVILSREDVSLLVELLHIISRWDLEKETIEWSNSSSSPGEQPRISTYRRLLHTVALESTTEDLEEIKYTTSGRISSNLEEIKDMFQVLTVMEKECLISEKDVSVLHDILANQLVIEKVKAYERTYSSAATEITASNSSIRNTSKYSRLPDPLQPNSDFTWRSDQSGHRMGSPLHTFYRPYGDNSQDSAYAVHPHQINPHHTKEFSRGKIYPRMVQPSSTGPAYDVNQPYKSKSQVTTLGQRNEFSFQQPPAWHDVNVLERGFKDLRIARTEASCHASSKDKNEQSKFSAPSIYQPDPLSSMNMFPPELIDEIGKGCYNNPGPQSNVMSSLKHGENILGSDSPYATDLSFSDISPLDIPIPDRGVMPCYKIDRNPRGLCIVINNENFQPKASSNLEYRQGSDKDAFKLLKLFNDLNFQVQCVNNRTALEMYDLLDSIRKYDHREYDCFICCILTHGSLGEVYGSDSVTIPITDLTGLFTGVKCESLAGKPKLFFIQACQGDRKQVGVKPASVADNPMDSIATIPNENDFLLGYSTVLGYLSYRSPDEGSWYIISLVNLMKRHHNEIDMQNLLALVNGHMGKCADKEGFKQSSFHKSTLTKALYL